MSRRDLVLKAVSVSVVLGWPNLLATKARSLAGTSAQVDCSQSPSRLAGKWDSLWFQSPSGRMTRGCKAGCTNQLASCSPRTCDSSSVQHENLAKVLRYLVARWLLDLDSVGGVVRQLLRAS